MEVTSAGKIGRSASAEQYNLIAQTRHQELEDLVSACPRFLACSLI